MPSEKLTQLDQIAERTALGLALPVGVVIGIAALLFNFNYPQLPISGNLHSIGFPILVGGFIVTLGVFYYGYLKGIRIKVKENKIRVSDNKLYFNAAVLSLIFSLLVAAFTGLLIVIFSNAFIGLTLDPYISSLLAGIYGSLIAYYIANLSIQLGVSDIIAALGIFLIGGVTISMLAVNDPYWWERNFSYLGTWDSGANRVFNLTLIFSALALLTVIEYVFEGYRKTILSIKGVAEGRYNFTKYLFVFMALAFGGVGLFPWKEDTIWATLHNTSVNLLAVALFFTLVAIRWLIPVFPKSFYINSYVMGGLFALTGFLFVFTGYLNQTAFEMACFFIAGAWILLFLKNITLLRSSSAVKAEHPVVR